jgi:hypothetical protein
MFTNTKYFAFFLYRTPYSPHPEHGNQKIFNLLAPKSLTLLISFPLIFSRRRNTKIIFGGEQKLLIRGAAAAATKKKSVYTFFSSDIATF